MHDFSLRIWLTCQKGFEPIGELKYVINVGWGCMLQSGHMLVAQDLLFHPLGRSWKRPTQQPFNQEYIDILRCSGVSPLSIHNLLEAGKPYGLTAGNWLGPYAMCRSWEELSRTNKGKLKLALPMAVYIVSGDEYGECGGVPVICIDDATKLRSERSNGRGEAQVPLLILVPHVLGLENINPSLGIAGGNPGAATYIVGVQDDQALYLDPHEVQQVVEISPDKTEVETGSYHCSVVRQMPLSAIDPSLAIGFYCRNRDDFDDLCGRASDLASQSEGAPLFTVAQSLNKSKQNDALTSEGVNSVAAVPSSEDDWQLL